eukprot:TRINITY_DN14407_c0_g3_i2.p1 TRINITY_DN14407_c0_g3~~TRINITY_DN14407_c0_g3_i2.p1  ORF type:complete len:206 (+),score=29.85 TRINITY_DN14407_c0_g3_i2:97-714(+)
MCIRDRYQRRVRGVRPHTMQKLTGLEAAGIAIFGIVAITLTGVTASMKRAGGGVELSIRDGFFLVFRAATLVMCVLALLDIPALPEGDAYYTQEEDAYGTDRKSGHSAIAVILALVCVQASIAQEVWAVLASKPLASARRAAPVAVAGLCTGIGAAVTCNNLYDPYPIDKQMRIVGMFVVTAMCIVDLLAPVSYTHLTLPTKRIV